MSQCPDPNCPEEHVHGCDAGWRLTHPTQPGFQRHTRCMQPGTEPIWMMDDVGKPADKVVYYLCVPHLDMLGFMGLLVPTT